MKKSYLSDLQSQILGQVTDSDRALDYFATDASMFRIRPQAVVYPRNTADVRRAVLMAQERTAAGKSLAITARGMGTDLSGAAVGEGLALVFPAHMNKVIDMDRRTVTVQAGANFWTVQQLLHAQARFLPPFPASQNYSTIGGAAANNSAGVKSVKYGPMRRYVRRIKAVLSDGSLVTLGRISPRQLQRKKGQTDLEGEIYRSIDRLVTDHRRLIEGSIPKTELNAAGYALDKVKGRDGSLDLAQLVIGSQGTLGLITELVIETMPWNPQVTLTVGFFDDLEKAGEALLKLRELEPSSLSMVGGEALEHLRRRRPQDVEGLIPQDGCRLVLLAEFDDGSQLAQLRKLRRAQKLFSRYAVSQRSSTNPLEQEALWRIRHSAGSLWMGDGSGVLPPAMSDAAVPLDKLAQLLTLVERLGEKHGIELLAWGEAGTGQLWVQPVLELGKKKTQDILPSLTEEYYQAVLSVGGSVSASHGDGLARASYLKAQYGEGVYELMRRVKEIFDPQGIFNPLAKFASAEAVNAALRDDYDINRYEYLPRT